MSARKIIETSSVSCSCSHESAWCSMEIERRVLPSTPKKRSLSVNMKMKRFFAGLIVALLLFVPSLGAACDLSCEFAQLASDCHLKREASQESGSAVMAMDGMAMDGMTDS